LTSVIKFEWEISTICTYSMLGGADKKNGHNACYTQAHAPGIIVGLMSMKDPPYKLQQTVQETLSYDRRHSHSHSLQIRRPIARV